MSGCAAQGVNLGEGGWQDAIQTCHLRCKTPCLCLPPSPSTSPGKRFRPGQPKGYLDWCRETTPQLQHLTPKPNLEFPQQGEIRTPGPPASDAPYETSTTRILSKSGPPHLERDGIKLEDEKRASVSRAGNERALTAEGSGSWSSVVFALRNAPAVDAWSEGCHEAGGGRINTIGFTKDQGLDFRLPSTDYKRRTMDLFSRISSVASLGPGNSEPCSEINDFALPPAHSRPCPVPCF
jgi:hypothetical protein